MSLNRLDVRLFWAIATFLITHEAFALPRFSILTGMQCINCHVNPTGGELRNSFGGTDFVNDHLRLIPAHNDSTDFSFDPRLNNYIFIGGDIRFQYLYDGNQKKTTFQSMEGTVYSLLQLFASTNLFVKYDFANTAYEAYGLYNFNSGNSYVKVGAFAPSYGVRLDDHTAYTRGGNLGFLQGLPQLGLFFVPNYRDLGVEIGSRFDNLFVTIDATNGDGTSNINFNSKKAFIGKMEYLTHGVVNFMIGGSGYAAGTTTMVGVQGGMAVGHRLTILGEYDWANSLPDVSPSGSHSNAAFAEVAYEIRNGLFAVARLDYFKIFNGTIQGQTSPIYTRYLLGLNIYPIPHVDLMPQIRFNKSSNAPGYPQPFEALLQSHIYF
jgi:hypothetical protein